jgi:hypothetical protein
MHFVCLSFNKCIVFGKPTNIKPKTHPSMDMLVTAIVLQCLGSVDGAMMLKHVKLHDHTYVQVVVFASIAFSTAKFCTPY